MIRYLFGFLCVCALGAVPLVGCSETADEGGSGGSAGTGGMAGSGGTGGTAGSGGSAGTGGMAGSGGTGGMGGDGGSGGMGGTVELFLITYEGDGWEAGPPLEGVEVCQTDTTNCTTSDVNGQVLLSLPANQEISYTLTKDGHMGWMAGDVTDERFGAEGGPRLPMFTNEQIEAFAEANAIPYPLTGGVTSHHMNPVRIAGVTYDLVDTTGLEYYVDDDVTHRFDLTATTSEGFGGSWEVPPGDHQVEFGGAATNCSVAIAWPGNAPNRVKVPVKVGFFTLASMNCDVQQGQ